jgi:hypothetical protein
MSDIYNSTSTMAMPGEPETDFTVRRPVWEQFNLPIGPKHTKGKGLIAAMQEAAELKKAAGTEAEKSGHQAGDTADAIARGFQRGSGDANDVVSGGNHVRATPAAAITATQAAGKKEIDWENFDFSAAEFGSFGVDDFATSEAQPAAVAPTLPSAEQVAQSLPEDARVVRPELEELTPEEITQRRQERLQRTSVHGLSCTSLIEPKFVLPEALGAHTLESEGYVGYDTWSKYGPDEGFDLDDFAQDDDIHYAQTMHHFKQVTDLFLDDHSRAVRFQDTQNNFTRVLSNALLGTNHTQEAFPSYLTPDANRGIKYTDVIIEMKGKRILHPVMPDPAVAYANDSFGPNPDAVAMNTIGTIRVQYDWQPRKDLVHEIEPHKVERLRPVIAFINHAAELQSTKVRVQPCSQCVRTLLTTGVLRCYLSAGRHHYIQVQRGDATHRGDAQHDAQAGPGVLSGGQGESLAAPALCWCGEA